MKAGEYFTGLCIGAIKMSERDRKLESLILSHLETVEKAKTRWVSRPAPSSCQPCYEEKEFHPFDSRMVLASALRLKEMGDE